MSKLLYNYYIVFVERRRRRCSRRRFVLRCNHPPLPPSPSSTSVHSIFPEKLIKANVNVCSIYIMLRYLRFFYKFNTHIHTLHIIGAFVYCCITHWWTHTPTVFFFNNFYKNIFWFFFLFFVFKWKIHSCLYKI